MSLLALQNYASDESSEEEKEARKNRLPVPDLPSYGVLKSISRVNNTQTSTNVDSSGKIRNFAHEAGNWATFVAIPIEHVFQLEECLDDLQKTFSDLSLQRIDDWHISLTRVIVLRHHWISSFVDSVRRVLANTSPFQIIFNGLSVYLNEEKTRTFLALKVYRGENDLNEIVDQMDKVLQEYGLPKFYEERSFHLSLLWAPGDVSKELKSRVAHDSIFFSSFYPVQVKSGFCKTGNKIFSFPLAT